MTAYKLGIGAAYASLTGFTWPDGENPSVHNIPIQKRIMSFDKEFCTINVNLSAGNQDSNIGLTGQLFTEANFELLRFQVCQNKLDADGVLINKYQKFYTKSDAFYWVMGSNFTDTANANMQGSWPYNILLRKVHPYEYADAIITETVNTSNTTATITGIDNDGNAEVFPYFEIINTAGATITEVSITDGTRTIDWVGTIAAGSSIRIVQENNPDLEQNEWAVYKYATTNFTGAVTNPSGLKGKPIFLLGATTGGSITATLTGNNDAATFNIKYRERDI
jgi:hypothetical protein